MTIEELMSAALDENDVPQIMIESGINYSKHVHRVYTLEKDDSLVFQNADGTNTTYIFSQKIKYVDEDGNVKDKSAKLVEKGDSFVSYDNDVKIKLSKSIKKGIELNYNDLKLVMFPVENTEKAHGTDMINSKALEYKEVFDESTSIIYSPTFDGIKCDIVLNKYTGKSTFDFYVKTYGNRIISDGDNGACVIDNDDKVLAKFNEIFIYDRENNITYGEIKIKQTEPNNEYILTVCVDDEYLKDSNTVYPVVIDPGTTVNQSGSGFIEYQTVYSNGTSQSNISGTNVNDLKIGYSSDKGIGRILYRFPGFYNDGSGFFNTMPASRILNVKLVQNVRYRSSLESMTAAQYTGDVWNTQTTFSNVDPTDVVSYTSIGTTYGGAYMQNNNVRCMYLDITDFVTAWKTTPNVVDPQRGILMINSIGEYSMNSSNVSIIPIYTTASPEVATAPPWVEITYNPYKIMLDAGHTTDYGPFYLINLDGSNYYVNGNPVQYYEGERMWYLQNALSDCLSEYGFVVSTVRSYGTQYFTNNLNEDPRYRGRLAGDSNLFVSLHTNAAGTSARRAVIIEHSKVTSQTHEIALEIAASIKSTIGLGSNGGTGVESIGYEIVTNNAMNFLEGADEVGKADVTIIVEHSFHTNITSALWLKNNSNLDMLAQNEAEAIARGFGIIE